MTCVEGRTAPSQLLALLQQAVADNAQLLWQEQAERQQRVRTESLKGGELQME